MHFDNLLFILLIAVALLFRWLASKSGQAGKNSEEQKRRSTFTPSPVTQASMETDEERVRKFLEALGQPTTSKPPPRVTPRTDIPPRPVAPIQPPPSMRPFSVPTRGLTPEEARKRHVILHEGVSGKSEEWLRKINSPGQIAKRPYEAKTFTPKFSEPLPFEVHAGAPTSEPSPPLITTPAAAYALATKPAARIGQPKTDIATLLTSTSGLRDAVVLREIFGPPRSLQPLDLIGSV